MSRNFGVAVIVVGWLIAGAITTRGQAGGVDGVPSAIAPLLQAKLKFNGALSCKGAGCHDEAKEKANGYSFSNEYTLWNKGGDDADPHHNKTWKALTNDLGKQITQKLKIANGAASDRCLSCHALNPPKELQGENFKLNEGVSCNACHGPSEKWRAAHSKKGWYEAEAKSNSSEQMLSKWGLYETLPIQQRAERCTACHLAIDPNLVAAGHPQPTFELNYFSDSYGSRHWREPDGYFKARLWAGGQQVALREALKQLATRASATGKTLDDAFAQAMSHYTMMNQILTVALPSQAAGLTAAMQKVEAANTSKSGLDAAASAAAAADAGLAQAIDGLKPDKALTVRILSGIAAQDLAAKYGKIGQDQESYAIYALYNALATSPDKPADADAVIGLIGDKLFADQTPAQYAQSLAAVRPKLPK